MMLPPLASTLDLNCVLGAIWPWNKKVCRFRRRGKSFVLFLFSYTLSKSQKMGFSKKSLWCLSRQICPSERNRNQARTRDKLDQVANHAKNLIDASSEIRQTVQERGICDSKFSTRRQFSGTDCDNVPKKMNGTKFRSGSKHPPSSPYHTAHIWNDAPFLLE